MTNDTKTQVMAIEGFVLKDGIKKRGFGLIKLYEFPGGKDDIALVSPATLIIGERGYSRTQMLAMVEEIVAKQAEYEEPDWIKAIADKHLGTDL